MNKNIISLPKVIFGTSSLGNLYSIVPDEKKLEIVSECIAHSPKPVVFDSAGKYGAGLALEELGKCLKRLNVEPQNVLISNKLGWYRTELRSAEPTFEPGVWKGLKYDALQRISYQGIIDCFNQGNDLLGDYNASLVSVHDPDEYLAAAHDEGDKLQRYNDVLDAYRALHDLKKQGKVAHIGIGSKDWTIIHRISREVALDWVMIANSMTVHSHPDALVSFMKELEERNVTIINSAVFNGGFLVGSDLYNYREVDRNGDEGKQLLAWRERFFGLCEQYALKPAEVCVKFGLQAPGVKAIALNTTDPQRVIKNIKIAEVQIPDDFWVSLLGQPLHSYFK